MRENIMGVCFDKVSLDEAVKKAVALIEEDKNHYIVTPNSEIVYMTRRDKELKKALNGASLALPDGIGIIYASRILKKEITKKVAGIEFAKAFIKKMEHSEFSLFLLGGKPGIAEKAAAELKKEYPGLLIRGTHDGYFSDDREIIDEINDSGATVLFVCMGAPKQELWMGKNAKNLNCRLMAGLGGSLDIFAGEAERAPDVFINAGLEWLYRLLKEPKRIGRMMRLPGFLFWTICAKTSGSYREL